MVGNVSSNLTECRLKIMAVKSSTLGRLFLYYSLKQAVKNNGG